MSIYVAGEGDKTIVFMSGGGTTSPILDFKSLAEERNQGYEMAEPITIGDNVWIGADVTILPGVTIGDNAVIGAKSLVSKDIPANVIAMGSPCKVYRAITDEDSIQDQL